MSSLKIDEHDTVPEAGSNPEFDDFLRELREEVPSNNDENMIMQEAWAIYKTFINKDEQTKESIDIDADLDESNNIPKLLDSEITANPVSNKEPDIFDLSLPSDMPNAVVNKIRKTFKSAVAEPSLIELVPIVRETLPDNLPLWWLKQKNIRDARFAISKANQDNLINAHVLNGMLQVETKASNIDKALAFHADQFSFSGLVRAFNTLYLYLISHLIILVQHLKKKPSLADDRLVLQMLVENRRISRALAFKDKVASEGRNIDIPSYGSLIAHYANRKELGSAIMLIKECLEVHGHTPGEQSLQPIRLLCRQNDITDEVGLTELIGPDPRAWIRKGEKELKREMSKKGRRGIQGVRNAFLRI